MSTLTIEQNILYGIGEGANVANATYLTYAMRWANAAYREMFLRHRFRHLRTRAIFRTTNGQQTYQAPDDFLGFLVLKDESKDTVIDQITPEEFARDVSATQVTDESWTSDSAVAVSLDNVGLLQYSETVTNTAGTTTFTRDTDYTMDYVSGTITMLAAGTMVTATEYYIDYLRYTTGNPVKFCIEYDETNTRYVFRLDPTPDSTKIMSLLYPDVPSDLSSAISPIWPRLEFALERGGIYYGSLEIIEDEVLRGRFEKKYEQAFGALMQLDLDLIPKHDRIPLVMRKSDYTSREVSPIGTTGVR